MSRSGIVRNVAAISRWGGLLLKPGEKKEAGWYKAFLSGFDRLTAGYDVGVQWVLRKLAFVGIIFVGWMAMLVFGVINTPTGFVSTRWLDLSQALFLTVDRFPALQFQKAKT